MGGLRFYIIFSFIYFKEHLVAGDLNYHHWLGFLLELFSIGGIRMISIIYSANLAYWTYFSDYSGYWGWSED